MTLTQSHNGLLHVLQVALMIQLGRSWVRLLFKFATWS